MQTYSLREVRSLLGLSVGVVRGLIAAGFVEPARGPRGAYRFDFRDLVLLRTARELQAGDVSPRRIHAALRRLRSQLPEAMPLSGLRLAAVGAHVVVREGEGQWHAASGQRLIDFEPIAAAGIGGDARRLDATPGSRRAFASAEAAAPPTAAASSATAPAEAAAARAGEAARWFRRGVEAEARDPPAAEAAYRRAIDADAACIDAVLNLGVLLGDSGRAAEAAALYRAAADRLPEHALLQFNLAVMLEDGGDDDAALAAYDRCLALDPAFADAHFNAARLHDRMGHAARAIRHYSAYRRLMR